MHVNADVCRAFGSTSEGIRLDPASLQDAILGDDRSRGFASPAPGYLRSSLLDANPTRSLFRAPCRLSLRDFCGLRVPARPAPSGAGTILLCGTT